MEEERDVYRLGVWLEPIYESSVAGLSQPPKVAPRNYRLCVRYRHSVMHSSFNMPHVSTKTARRDKTDGPTSGPFVLPLFREYTFQSTRMNMARAAIVPEFVVPFWGVADVSAGLLQIKVKQAEQRTRRRR